MPAARRRTPVAPAATDRELVRLAPRVELVLLALYHLGPEKTYSYEDIVVSAFRHYPKDFAMRGYPDYPDSSDVHVPLYKELKSAGYVVVEPNKRFRLTSAGFERARMRVAEGGGADTPAAGRTRRATTMELRRLAGTEAARRFAEDRMDSVLDTDFHEFFGTSVRTDDRDFLGRLNQVKEWIGLGVQDGLPEATALDRVRKALLEKFDRELVRPRGGAPK
jgi:hypothetical protein